MHMDVGGQAIGATRLQQDDNGDLCLVTCISSVSRKLNPAERNYPTFEREERGGVCGQCCSEVPENCAEFDPTSGAYFQFISRMRTYQAKPSAATDALSRLIRLSPMQSVESEKDDGKRAYLGDPVMGSKFFTASGGSVDLTIWHSERLWMTDRILVPSGKVREVLRMMHGNELHGHCGMRKLYDLVAGKYFPTDSHFRFAAKRKRCRFQAFCLLSLILCLLFFVVFVTKHTGILITTLQIYHSHRVNKLPFRCYLSFSPF